MTIFSREAVSDCSGVGEGASERPTSKKDSPELEYSPPTTPRGLALVHAFEERIAKLKLAEDPPELEYSPAEDSPGPEYSPPTTPRGLALVAKCGGGGGGLGGGGGGET